MKNQLVVKIALALLLALPAQADQVQYVKHADQALAVFFGLAQNAQRSIDLATFIFEPCDVSGQLMLDILAKKARNGVKVRLFLDAFMQNKSEKKNIAAFAAANGIDLRWYHNPLLLNPTANQRSHVKLMVVDNRTYVSGGRNIADEYFSLRAGANFYDRDAFVTGSSASGAAAAFAELWESDLTSEPRTREEFVSWKKFCGSDVSGRVSALRRFLGGYRKMLASMPSRQCSKVNFVMDMPDFGRGGRFHQGPGEQLTPETLKRKRATNAVLRFLAGVRSRLDLENWSYMPSASLRRALDKIRGKNIPIHVVTNEDMDGPGILKPAEEHVNNRSAARDTKGSQVVMQVSRYGTLRDDHGISPGGTTYRLHGKVFVRNRRDGIVGSFNIDPRSYHGNVESLVVVENCPGFAADLEGGVRDITEVYMRDVKSGTVPPPSKPGLLARIAAFWAFQFL